MKPIRRSIILVAATLLVAACGSNKEPEVAKESAAQDEHGAEGEGHVELSPAAAQAAGVELETVGPSTVGELLLLYGSAQQNAERVRDVTARYAGLIRSVTKKVGDRVRQGETLAIIESNESLSNYVVTAPLTGVVTARNVNPGEKAGDAPLFTIADLSTVWVELSLFPRDLAKVRMGQKVRIKTADEGMAADGRIAYIAPIGQPGSQTLSARVPIDNPDQRWAPGLYVTGEVALSEATVPIAVKSSALQIVENRSVVFVESGDGFQAQPVVLGRADGERTEIISGLKVGSRYAAANSFVLKSEMGKGEAEHEH
jgi:cobalt-zinc-cadmium efflux system membrane fusion protein